ncbi:unnamed protein product [Bursaphelenchus xylophilus]|uniref:(pine wood nematode) hypothetical protein n=1 Tax=Bursaphelenchus xylophilus TaxID=6326 RepID=A0A7I8X7K7_BURXY|nr:unnamed protein product [Bursaphelenchus xylophilus]CAG9126517.1 unnamed protein product [Bursaphelenchus xylophilus]
MFLSPLCLLAFVAAAVGFKVPKDCKDRDSSCNRWSSLCKCTTLKDRPDFCATTSFAKKYCQKSCGFCNEDNATPTPIDNTTEDSHRDDDNEDHHGSGSDEEDKDRRDDQDGSGGDDDRHDDDSKEDRDGSGENDDHNGSGDNDRHHDDGSGEKL